MTITAKELRFQTSMLFELLEKGEEILITYRGKAKAKLVPCDRSTATQKSDAMFGMQKDKEMDVDQTVRQMRAGRSFDI